jgi:hypothetical protein
VGMQWCTGRTGCTATTLTTDRVAGTDLQIVTVMLSLLRHEL